MLAVRTAFQAEVLRREDPHNQLCAGRPRKLTQGMRILFEKACELLGPAPDGDVWGTRCQCRCLHLSGRKVGYKSSEVADMRGHCQSHELPASVGLAFSVVGTAGVDQCTEDISVFQVKQNFFKP